MSAMLRFRLGLLCFAALVAACGKSQTAECEPGKMYSCYDGPAGTDTVGVCRKGSALCMAAGKLGVCEGEIIPESELCDGDDNNCNGQVDEGVTNACGGCTLLEHQPGEPCAPCGTYACAGREVTNCSGGRLNNCGQCNTPDVIGLNTACVGGNGCPGSNACPDAGIDPVCVAAQKNNCGVCGATAVPGIGDMCNTGGCSGTLACNMAGLGSVCGGPARNNCNACGLPNVERAVVFRAATPRAAVSSACPARWIPTPMAWPTRATPARCCRTPRRPMATETVLVMRVTAALRW